MNYFTFRVLFAVLRLLPQLGRASSDYPKLAHDPDTISPCLMWENNSKASPVTCEEARDSWNISPNDFSRWNPSVGLDCKPWYRASYCVVPEEIVDPPPTTTTTENTPEPTTSTQPTSTGPEPTNRPDPKWEDLGCYDDDVSDLPLLEERVNKVGDKSLSVGKCKSMCYQSGFEFAGVKEGDECHCGNELTGETAFDQEDCKIPCVGKSSEICGGKKKMNVFQALTETD